MKKITVERRDLSVCHSQSDVSIELDNGEAEEIRSALKLIQKYEKIALKAIKEKTKICPTTSDWHNVQYAVKNDKIIVIVTDGMIG